MLYLEDKKKIAEWWVRILGLAMIMGMLCLGGCKGGGGEGSGQEGGVDEIDDQSGQTNTTQWEQTSLVRIEAGGMLSPQVKAAQDASGRIHLLYFQDSNDTAYQIHYLTFEQTSGEVTLDKVTLAKAILETSDKLVPDKPAPDGLASDRALLSPLPEAEAIVAIDNCLALSLALDQDHVPVVAYRGGEIRECGREQQSDAMLSLKGVAGWEEYTGAIGVVERNPVFHDGLAGTQVSVAVDTAGNIHLAYQFFYEGCDAMNYQYPDLCYVKKDRSSLQTESQEEQVEGNDYEEENSQNSVGYHCSLTLDGEENPAIFYYAVLPDHTRGLRVARKRNGVWEKEWIETGCEVGAVSGAWCEKGGYLGVAYYVKQYVDGRDAVHCLRYAREDVDSSSWLVEMADETAWCGDYCCLAFDAVGDPAIAYYEMKTHTGYLLNNLKMARLRGTFWERQVVASTGDIGLYNSLWFDERSQPVICTYSKSQQTIYLYSGQEVTVNSSLP